MVVFCIPVEQGLASGSDLEMLSVHAFHSTDAEVVEGTIGIREFPCVTMAKEVI